jgi:hypothetical protein
MPDDNKCAAGVRLPRNGGPCPECGNGPRDGCPRRDAADRAELLALRGQIAELQRDAERLTWLDNNLVEAVQYGTERPPMIEVECLTVMESGRDLREAIDRAMASAKTLAAAGGVAGEHRHTEDVTRPRET